MLESEMTSVVVQFCFLLFLPSHLNACADAVTQLVVKRRLSFEASITHIQTTTISNGICGFTKSAPLGEMTRRLYCSNF